MTDATVQPSLAAPRPTVPPGVRRYAVAVVASAIALAASWFLASKVATYPTTLMMLAVMVAAWYGGFGPALLATALLVSGAVWLLIEPAGPGPAHYASPTDVMRIGLFVIAAVAVSALAAGLRRARADAVASAKEAEDLAQQLAEQNVELEQQIEESQALTEELEAARLDAENANRAKAAFLAVTSHELRTPLNAIIGYAQLLEMEIHGTLSEGQREHVRRTQASAKRLLTLIDEILTFARLETGRAVWQIDNVPVAEVLTAVETVIAPQIASRGLTYRCADCPDGLMVRADRQKLEQILLNLLGNAIKFTDAGGTITLAAEQRDGVVLLRVSDTGIGISEDRLADIFEPFVQAHATDSRASGGVGLGLAISRDMAAGMGGHLTAASELGQGSVFTISLPAAS